MLSGPARVAAVAQVFVDDLDALVVEDDDVHHLTRVLRVRPGETVVAADGRGHWRCCRFTGTPGALVEADGPTDFEPSATVPVTVGFVPVKGDRPEWVVQKLTELGIDHVVVLRSARSVVRWEGARAERALERLTRVARQAAAQSRRAWLPVVDGVWSLSELAATFGPGQLAAADPGGPPLDGGTVALAVGPEGGWDGAELEVPGMARAGLATGVLRAETAALAAATLLGALRDRSLRPW